MMFVTIACGAISGFHCLVSSGTTCKQCSSEQDAKRIGFDGMLLECVLALFVLLAIGSALGFEDYKIVVWNEGNPVLGFALAAGKLANTGLGFIPVALGTVFGILMLEGFLVTTLDSAVRLNRYLFEELWDLLFENPPAFMKKYWFNAGLSVALMWILAGSNAATAIWPVFGSSNQLLGGPRPDRRQHLAAEPRHPAVVHADTGGVHDGDHPVLAGAADAEAHPRGELPAGRRRGRAFRARPGSHRYRHPDPCRRRPEARAELIGT